MSYRTEFPDFVLPVTIPEGFEDSSWHHDECPTWRHEGRGLLLSIDDARAEGRDSSELPRFSLGRLDEDGQATDEIVISTVHWDEVLRALEG